MKTSFLRIALLFGLAAVSACTAYSAPAPGSAKLTFRRVFKSSSPEFVQIAVQQDSDTSTYEIRQLDEDAGASPLPLSTAASVRIAVR